MKNKKHLIPCFCSLSVILCITLLLANCITTGKTSLSDELSEFEDISKEDYIYPDEPLLNKKLAHYAVALANIEKSVLYIFNEEQLLESLSNGDWPDLKWNKNDGFAVLKYRLPDDWQYHQTILKQIERRTPDKILVDKWTSAWRLFVTGPFEKIDVDEKVYKCLDLDSKALSKKVADILRKNRYKIKDYFSYYDNIDHNFSDSSSGRCLLRGHSYLESTEGESINATVMLIDIRKFVTYGDPGCKGHSSDYIFKIRWVTHSNVKYPDTAGY